MPISEYEWKYISMDFMVGFPKTLRKHNSILVIIDKLTKFAYFISIRVDYNAAKLAKIYVKKIIRLYGVPMFVVPNRGTQFTFNF